MSVTKLKTVGRWGLSAKELTEAGARPAGRRILVGMLTGTDDPPDAPAPAAGEAGERSGPHE